MEQYHGKDKVAQYYSNDNSVSNPFYFRYHHSLLYDVRVREPLRLIKGDTYYLIPLLYYYDNGTYVTEAEGAKVKLNIKWSDTRAKITTTLKASGSIDLIQPGSAVTLTTGPLKNCYTYGISPSDLSFSTDKAGTDIISGTELPFEIGSDYKCFTDGSMECSVYLKENFRDKVLPTDKYYVRILIPEGTSGTDGQEVTTKPVQIKLTKGKAKITSTVKSVQLLKNDRFSYANIGVLVPNGLTDIREITLDSKSDARFFLINNGSGNLELHMKQDNPVTANTTVKLNVFLLGNNTAKPDATISVAVKFS